MVLAEPPSRILTGAWLSCLAKCCKLLKPRDLSSTPGSVGRLGGHEVQTTFGDSLFPKGGRICHEATSWRPSTTGPAPMQIVLEPRARAQRMEAQAHTLAHRLISVLIQGRRRTSRSE